MKRWALRICVFLLLGAIVNVALATLLAFRIPSDRSTTLEHLPASLGWLDSICVERKGELVYRERVSLGVSLHKSVPRNWPTDQPPPFYVEWIAVQAGWPLPSLRGHIWQKTTPHGAGVPPTVDPDVYRGLHHTVRKTGGRHEHVYVPHRVAPAGFAINTLFYAVILWLLSAAPVALRRRRRVKRGLCPACGYPVGDSEVCTECGKPVRPALMSRISHTRPN